MRHFLPPILAALIFIAGPAGPTASASFLGFGKPHLYRHHGHIYTHRKWVPANGGFAGFYRYW